MSNIKYTRSERSKAILLAKDGMPNADIALQMGIPDGTIKTWTRGHHARRPGRNRSRARRTLADTVVRTVQAGKHLWWSLTGWAPR